MNNILKGEFMRKKLKIFQMALGLLILSPIGMTQLFADSTFYDVPLRSSDLTKNRLSVEEKEQLKKDYLYLISLTNSHFSKKGLMSVTKTTEVSREIKQNKALNAMISQEIEVQINLSDGSESISTLVLKNRVQEDGTSKLVDSYVKLTANTVDGLDDETLNAVTSFLYYGYTKKLLINFSTGDDLNSEEGVTYSSVEIAPNNLKSFLDARSITFRMQENSSVRLDRILESDVSRVLSSDELKSYKESLKRIKDCREMDEDKVDEKYESCPLKDLSSLLD
jgi:hypothetical protein